jgi:hypothetical protein
MMTQYQRNTVQLSELDLEEYTTFSTFLPASIGSEQFTAARRSSIACTASFHWDGTTHIILTSPGETTGQYIGTHNWSYFYPSVAGVCCSTGCSISVSNPCYYFFKAAALLGQCRNDTDPYSLDQYYSASSISGGYTLPSTIPDSMISLKMSRAGNWTGSYVLQKQAWF